jgi:antitoxin MazE6
MKTAISIPDKLFLAADQYAKQHGFSRSNLYAKAVAQFLEQHPTDFITKQLNEVYPTESSKLNKNLSTMQFNTIDKEKWE